MKFARIHWIDSVKIIFNGRGRAWRTCIIKFISNRWRVHTAGLYNHMSTAADEPAHRLSSRVYISGCSVMKLPHNYIIKKFHPNRPYFYYYNHPPARLTPLMINMNCIILYNTVHIYSENCARFRSVEHTDANNTASD